jgi:ATP-dependent exoDNAse (exonuclease V) alpha subunit
MTHRRLSVYEPERAEIAPGDRVRITRNDAALDLANGDRFTVAAVGPRTITLADGRRTVELPADGPLHLDHAYATTIHSSQGTTADRVLIDAATKSRTTAKDVYYVAISRAQQEARIYTDDMAKLPLAIERERPKHAALDLERG